MRKKYLSALLFGALLVTSAGTFTSCKDYDDDIKNLQEQIDVIKTDLASLTETVNNLDGVKDMYFTDGKLYIETGEGKKVEVNIPSASGIAKVELKDNVLYVNDEPQGEVVIPEDVDVKVEVKEDGKLYINDEVQPLEIGDDVAMVDNGDYYTMTIVGEGSYNLPKYNAANELNYVTIPTSLTFGQTAGTSTGLLDGFSWGYSNNEIEWNGSKIAAKTLLVGTIGTANGISVSPANFDLGAQKLELVNTEGQAADVNVFATPAVEIVDGKPATDGTNSRAASANGKWNLAIELKDNVTPDNISSAFQTEDGYVLYALSVNGKLVTAYDIAIKAEATATTNLDALKIQQVEIKVNGENYYGTGTFNINSGTPINLEASKYYSVSEKNTISITGKPNLVDAYISFEGVNKDLAAEYNVTIDGMSIIGSEKAAGKTLNVTLHLLNVSGKISTFPLQVIFAGSEISTPAETPATEYKVTNVAADKYFWVNVKDMFTATQLQNFGTNNANLTVAFEDSETALCDITEANINFFCEDKKTTFTPGKDEASKLVWMKVPVATLVATATEGEQTLVTTLSNGVASTPSEVCKFTTKVNVVLPTWDELFKFNTADAAWNDDVFTATLSGDKTISIASALVSLDASNYPVGGLKYDVDKISIDLDNAISTSTDNQISTALAFTNEIINDDNQLAATELSIPVYYQFTGSNLKVSKTINVKLRSIFEGVEVVYYTKNDLSTTGDASLTEVTGQTNLYKIEGATLSGTKKAGLAIKFNGKEVSFNYVASGIEISGLTITASNPSDDDDIKVAVALKDNAAVFTGVSIDSTDNIKISTNATPKKGDRGVVTVTFTDKAGVEIVKDVPFVY